MKILLLVDVDDTDLVCERTLEELETTVTEHEGMTLVTAGRSQHVDLVQVQEIPADVELQLDALMRGEG